MLILKEFSRFIIMEKTLKRHEALNFLNVILQQCEHQKTKFGYFVLMGRGRNLKDGSQNLKPHIRTMRYYLK